MTMRLFAVAALFSICAPVPGGDGLVLRASRMEPDAPLTFDGRLDEPVWAKAARHRGMTLLGKTDKPSADAELRLFHDGRRLFVGMRAREPFPEKLRREVGPDDGLAMKIFETDDVLECFIVQGLRHRAQYAFNPNGVFFFGGIRPDKQLYRDWRQPRIRAEWKPRAEYAVAVGAGEWSVELAIDLADFGGFADGGWRMAFARERRGAAAELSSLGALPGGSFLGAADSYPPLFLEGLTPETATEAPAAAGIFPRRPTDWNAEGTALDERDGVFALRGKGKLLSMESLPVDPRKNYVLRGSFRAEGAPTIPFYLALAPYDADQRPITPQRIRGFADTVTELLEPVGPGDSVLVVKDASKWRAGNEYFVAFNARADFSDLPSVSLNEIGGVREVAKDGERYLVALGYPAKIKADAGTMVREHSTGASYPYADGKASDATGEWRTFTVKTTGMAEPGTMPFDRFWPGTRHVRLLVWRTSAEAGHTLNFRDLRLEVVD